MSATMQSRSTWGLSEQMPLDSFSGSIATARPQRLDHLAAQPLGGAVEAHLDDVAVPGVAGPVDLHRRREPAIVRQHHRGAAVGLVGAEDQLAAVLDHLDELAGAAAVAAGH